MNSRPCSMIQLVNWLCRSSPMSNSVHHNREQAELLIANHANIIQSRVNI